MLGSVARRVMRMKPKRRSGVAMAAKMRRGGKMRHRGERRMKDARRVREALAA